MSLSAEQVTCRAAGRTLLDGVAITVNPGEVHAVLGPNGAGKSTLIRVLAGEIPVQAGGVTLNGRALAEWSPRARAQQRAVLPQRAALRFGFSAADVVSLGRLPCERHAPAAEAAIVRGALVAAGAADLSARRYPTLSIGEQSRVQLARVLAQVWEPVSQGPRYLLLDEPTASLDLAHQHACLGAIRARAAGGIGVLATLHDPNLAIAYADRITLLSGGRVTHSAAPRDLDVDRLRELYGIDLDVLETPAGRWIAARVDMAAPGQSRL